VKLAPLMPRPDPVAPPPGFEDIHDLCGRIAAEFDRFRADRNQLQTQLEDRVASLVGEKLRNDETCEKHFVREQWLQAQPVVESKFALTSSLDDAVKVPLSLVAAPRPASPVVAPSPARTKVLTFDKQEQAAPQMEILILPEDVADLSRLQMKTHDAEKASGGKIDFTASPVLFDAHGKVIDRKQLKHLEHDRFPVTSKIKLTKDRSQDEDGWDADDWEDHYGSEAEGSRTVLITARQNGKSLQDTRSKQLLTQISLGTHLGDDDPTQETFTMTKHGSLLLGAVDSLVLTKQTGHHLAQEEAYLVLSYWQRLRVDRYFQNFVVETVMAAVILANTITIGISCDYERESIGWIVVEFIFVCMFIAERGIKLKVLGWHDYWFGVERVWNLFETSLLVLNTLEVAIGLHVTIEKSQHEDNMTTSLLKVVRLVRVVKILRILRLNMFKDLMIMVNGVIGGIQTLFWSVVLICLPLYVIALILRETAGNIKKDPFSSTEPFSTLGSAFFTMFRCVVSGDCSDSGGRPIFVLLSEDHGWHFALLYCATMVFMTFGLFNVIVSIYVENTVQAAKYNELSLKHKRLQDEEMFTEKVKELLDLVWFVKHKHFDKTGMAMGSEGSVAAAHFSRLPNKDQMLNMEIDPKFFSELCTNARFRDILGDLDVSEEDQLGLFDTLDVDGGGTLDLQEMMLGIAKLRGDPRRADIISVGLTLRSVQTQVQGFEAHMSNELKKQRRLVEKALVALGAVA